MDKCKSFTSACKIIKRGYFRFRSVSSSLLPQNSLHSSRRTFETSIGATSKGSYSKRDSACCQQRQWSPNSNGGLKWCAGKVIPLFFPPIKNSYFVLKSENYTKMSSLMRKGRQLVTTNQPVFVTLRCHNLTLLWKEEKEVQNPPVMLKIRWKWWQQIAIVEGWQCENSPSVDPFKRNHVDGILHSRVTHSSVESHAHTPNFINQGTKANILSSPLLKSQGIYWGLSCDPTC